MEEQFFVVTIENHGTPVMPSEQDMNDFEDARENYLHHDYLPKLNFDHWANFIANPYWICVFCGKRFQKAISGCMNNLITHYGIAHGKWMGRTGRGEEYWNPNSTFW